MTLPGLSGRLPRARIRRRTRGNLRASQARSGQGYTESQPTPAAVGSIASCRFTNVAVDIAELKYGPSCVWW
jgi:hypothetical protein